MLVRLDQTLHKHGLIFVVLQELFHLGWKLFQRLTLDGVYAHGFSEEDKVWIRRGRVGVPGGVEEV